jgi:hypothetical protein
MTIKIKDEKLQAAKLDVKGLEKKLQRRNTEVDTQKHAIVQNEAEDRKRTEQTEAILKKRDIELERLKALLDEKEAQHRDELAKVETKQAKREQRTEQ